jgi:Ca2+-binding RTX toxin-like protein
MTGTGSVSVASGASFVLDAQSTITKNVVDIASGDGHVALNGGSANDTFGFTGNFAAADAVDGGGGVNTLALDGNYSAGIVFGATTVQNVAILMLADGFSYSIATGDATVAAGQTLTVKGVALKGANTLHFDGSAETDGSFVLDGGQGNDVLHAGAGTDTLYGDLGADTLTGGAGSDTFVYKAAAESAGGSYDIITDFDASHDEIALPFTIRAIDPTQTAASLNQLPTAFDAAHLGAHHAALAIVGTNTFLVVDANGTAGYQSGADILIDVTGMTGPLTTGSFA